MAQLLTIKLTPAQLALIESALMYAKRRAYYTFGDFTSPESDEDYATERARRRALGPQIKEIISALGEAKETP